MSQGHSTAPGTRGRHQVPLLWSYWEERPDLPTTRPGPVVVLGPGPPNGVVLLGREPTSGSLRCGGRPIQSQTWRQARQVDSPGPEGPLGRTGAAHPTWLPEAGPDEQSCATGARPSGRTRDLEGAQSRLGEHWDAYPGSAWLSRNAGSLKGSVLGGSTPPTEGTWGASPFSNKTTRQYSCVGG